MGWKYEVCVWDTSGDRPYDWFQIYAGPSMFKAIYKMWKARQYGWKCIKLEYRP